MSRTLLTLATLFVVILATVYQISVKPVVTGWGLFRDIELIGNSDCKGIPELKACEKIILHQPTGVLYLACSTTESRAQWTPALDRINAAGRSEEDYIATYDPQTSKITRLKILGYHSDRGLSVYGMDVVPSSADPTQLFVYVVNHRIPLLNRSAKDLGADSSIEIYRTTVGGSTLTHLKTVEDQVVITTPNDIVGSSDGQSFHFTNDHGFKTGLNRRLELFCLKGSNVGYCHVDTGCKFAIQNLHSCSGIARAPNNDTFYVSDSSRTSISALERQQDNTLVLTELIRTDRGIDSLSIDEDGQLWGAGFPNMITTLWKHVDNPTGVLAPSSALRISINTGPAAFYGEKYKVEKVFEDGGEISSATTSVVYDSVKRRLFMHGLSSPQLTVCRI